MGACLCVCVCVCASVCVRMLMCMCVSHVNVEIAKRRRAFKLVCIGKFPKEPVHQRHQAQLTSRK